MSKSPKLQPDWIAPKRTALILIDVQVDFGAPDGVLGQMGMDMAAPQAAIPRIEQLVEAARQAGVICIFTRYASVPGRETSIEREEKKRRHEEERPELCVEGTHGAAFLGPQPRKGETVITKRRYSVFARTELGETLHNWHIDTLVLCGLTTECCVQASAWDAFERDFHVFIAADACAAYEDDLHAAALKALELSGATLAQTDALVAAWK